MRARAWSLLLGVAGGCGAEASGPDADSDTDAAATSGGSVAENGSAPTGSGSPSSGSPTASGDPSESGSGSDPTAGESGTDDGIPPPDDDVDDPNLVVIAWNGRASAVSLTFDDGDPTHYDVAAPVLDERGVKATFFVVANTVDGMGQGAIDGFGDLGENGHELANHTMTHTGSSAGTAAEVTDCHAWLQSTYGVSASTFAYPNVDITATYEDAAAGLYVASRGGGDGAHVMPGDDPNWHELPSWFVSDPETDPGYLFQPDETIAALQETVDAGGWRILTFHGVGPSGFWASTSPENIAAIVDSLDGDDVWIDTFGRVAGYLRAQRLLETATPSEGADGSLQWTWDVPPGFPDDVALRVVIDGGTLTQAGDAIDWNGAAGFYPVDPEVGELTWAP